MRGTTEDQFDVGLKKVTLDSTAVTVPWNFKFPADAGTSGTALTTDGAGNLSWSAPTAGAGGPDKSIQFNNSGALDGSNNLEWDYSTNSYSRLRIGFGTQPGNPALVLQAGGQQQEWAGYSTTGGTLFTARGGAALQSIGLQFYSDSTVYDIAFRAGTKGVRLSPKGSIGVDNAPGQDTHNSYSWGNPGDVLTSQGDGQPVVWASAGAASDNTTPYYIPVGETFTNNLNRQNLFHTSIFVDGTLEVNGLLIEV